MRPIQQTIYGLSKFLAKLGVMLIAFVILLAVIVISITQIEPARKWAIERGVASVNSILQGKLTVGDIEGNFINGLTIHDVRLEAGGGEFAYVPRITLRYKLMPIFESRNVTVSAILHQPRINLIRSYAGVWNFSQIVKPSVDSIDTERTPIAWIFDVGNLEMRNGSIRIDDRSRSRNRRLTNQIDLLHTRLDRVNLAMASYFSEEKQSAQIRHLSFTMTDDDFRLVDLAGGVSLDAEGGLVLDDMRIETDRSYLELSAHIESKPLFDTAFGSDLLEQPFLVDLDADAVATDELERFIPEVAFLGGNVRLDLRAEGTLSDIEVEHLDLDLDRSSMHIEGRLTDLTEKGRYHIDVEMSDSKIYASDVPRHVPGLGLPDLSRFAEVDIERLTYSGTPRDFVSVFDLESTVGAVKGGGWMEIGGGTPMWRVDAALEGVDPGAITENAELKGDVNGRVVAEGRAFDPKSLTTRFRSALSSTTFAGRHVSCAWIDGAYGEGGMITLDTAVVATAEGGSTIVQEPSLDELDGTLNGRRIRDGFTAFEERLTRGATVASCQDGSPGARLAGWVDIKNPKIPRYRLNVETDRFNLADITLDKRQQTRIGMIGFVEGSGLSPDDIDGVATIDVVDLILPDGESINPFKANVTLDRLENGERNLILTSDQADLELKGRWRFSSLFPTLAGGFEKLAGYISRKRTYSGDDLFLLTDEETGVEPIYATYKFVPKDLSVLSAFMPGTTFEMEATLEGEITGTTQLLGITTVGDIKRFVYRKGDQSIRFADVQIDADIRNITAGSLDDLLDAQISFVTSQPIFIGETKIDLPALDLTFEDGVLQGKGVTTIDEAYVVRFDGRINVHGETAYDVVLDTLSVTIKELAFPPTWTNVEPVRLHLDDLGIEIESLRMARENAETITVTGRVSQFERFQDVHLSVVGLPLQQLTPFLSDPAVKMYNSLNGNLDSLTFGLSGTLDSPVIEGGGDIYGLSYNNVPIGDVRIDLTYADRLLKGGLEIRKSPSLLDSTRMVLATVDIASLPIDLAFAARSERLITGAPLNITAQTNQLPLAFLGPFVPGVVIQRGTATVNFSMTGNYPNIRYSGDGKVEKGLITLETTNIRYLIDARFSLTENRLDIVSAQLRNLPTDYGDGLANLNGTITLEAMKPKQFDLNIRTAPTGILLLSDASEIVNDTYYGDLIIANSGGPIHFGGTYEAPTLTGDIIVLDSDLKLPYQEAYSEFAGRVAFVSYEQHVSATDLPVIVGGPDTTRKDTTGSLTDPDPSQRKSPSESSLAERLHIKLGVYIPNRAKIRIELALTMALPLIFNDGGKKLEFEMLGDHMSLTGTVNLLEGSKFNFIKSFDASGVVTFEEDIQNPSFSIDGAYNVGRSFSNTTDYYTVTVTVRGSRVNPSLTFDYKINGITPTDDIEKRQNDAILLLLFGSRNFDKAGEAFKDLGVQVAQDIFGSAISAGISGLFNDVGGIQTIDIDFSQSSDPSQAKLKFEYVLGNLIARYDGRFSSLGEGTFSLELPLSLLFDLEQLNKFSLELQREVIDQFEADILRSSSSSAGDQIYRGRISFRTTW